MITTSNMAEIMASDLRAEIARSNLRHYVVASRSQVNPARLSSILNERAPLPKELARRILEAVQEK